MIEVVDRLAGSLFHAFPACHREKGVVKGWVGALACQTRCMGSLVLGSLTLEVFVLTIVMSLSTLLIYLLLEHFCRSEYDVSTRRLRAFITYWCHVCCFIFLGAMNNIFTNITNVDFMKQTKEFVLKSYFQVLIVTS